MKFSNNNNNNNSNNNKDNANKDPRKTNDIHSFFSLQSFCSHFLCIFRFSCFVFAQRCWASLPDVKTVSQCLFHRLKNILTPSVVVVFPISLQLCYIAFHVKIRPLKLQNLLKLFPFGYCIFILHKVTVLFVLSLYLYIPVGQLCVFVFGCLGVWERDTEREREREYADAREACIKREITFARETILVTYNLEIFLRFCFLSIHVFLKKLKFQMMVFQRSPTDSFQVMNESRKTLSGMRKGLWEQGWYSILIKILNKVERGSTNKQ